MKTIADSHTDHVTEETLAWLCEHFAERSAFFIETVDLPEHLGTVECGLQGPSMGDEPVPGAECREVFRPGRETRGVRWPSRVCDRPVRQTRMLTVIAGPDGDEPCVLYTAYAGPAAPREPGDPDIPDQAGRDAAAAFWADHAVSCPTKRVRVLVAMLSRQTAEIVVEVPIDATDDDVKATAWDQTDTDEQQVEWEDDTMWGCDEGTHEIITEEQQS